MTPRFEQGPIRPPSEAHSLLVRVIRNCAWNRCAFCPVYKGSRPSNRSVEEIVGDIDAMAAAAEALGRTGAEAIDREEVPREAFQVALFLRGGGRHVFLQDADPIAVPAEKLAAVLRRVHERFPTVERVTTYGRAATLARRSVDQLRSLAGAGLTRVHVGLESGSDEVLAAVEKGCTADGLVEAGRRVLEAGLELCFYVMPGLGGRKASAEHAAGTADVLRRVAAHATTERPLVVRLRTSAVAPGTPLASRELSGDFTLPDDVETAVEIRAMLEALGDARIEVRSDHALNLLPEIDGSWPADRERLLGYLDAFLSMPPLQRARFALGRRLGIYGSLEDAHDPYRNQLVLGALHPASDSAEREILDAARILRAQFV